MIISFIKETQRKWDVHLNDFRFAFNTAYHSSLKTSPSFLNFCRDPLPQGTLHEKLEPVTSEPPRPGNVDTWSERVKRLEALRDLMKRHLDAAHNKQAHAYNLRVRPRSYQIGDRVLRRDRTLSSASKGVTASRTNKFDGIFTVSRVISPTIYELVNERGESVGCADTKDLKPYLEAAASE